VILSNNNFQDCLNTTLSWLVPPRGHARDPERHVVQPGLAVVEVAACDDQTAFTIQELLAWVDHTLREYGEDHPYVIAKVHAKFPKGAARRYPRCGSSTPSRSKTSPARATSACETSA
jgi:hypothetical protein